MVSELIRSLPEWRFMAFKNISAYWFQNLNFGDQLTPLLLEDFGWTVRFAPPSSASIVVIGSVLHQLPVNYGGIILGCGCIMESDRPSFRAAQILGVRGLLTKRALRIKRRVMLGDPGLLVRRLANAAVKKEFVLGIIPHQVELGLRCLKTLEQRNSPDVKIIDVKRPPARILADIASCQYIMSSSLHGLVAADALGIPNCWITLSDKILGATFKFLDYYSSYGVTRLPTTFTGHEKLSALLQRTLLPSGAVTDVAGQLEDAFERLPDLR